MAVILPSFVVPVEAAPASVILDVNSLSQVDVSNQTTFSFAKTFRVGVILDINTTAGSVSDVYGFQFVLHYDTAYLTAQADPPVSTDFFSSACYSAPPCSENADAAVKFGAQMTAGTVNWNGLLAIPRAFSVIIIDGVNRGPGTVFVGLTLLSPEPGKTISADTLLANVAFELDALPPSPLSFTLSEVIIVDSVAAPIPGILTGGPVSATITNSPPVAAGTVSNLNPLVGEVVSFDASTSTDDTSVTDYVWDFGVGDVDLDGHPETSCDVVAGTCTSATGSYTYTTPGVYKVTLRVRDTSGATGSSQDALGQPLANDQPSHRSFTLLVNTPPTVTFAVSPTSSPIAIPVSAAITSSDPDGTIATTRIDWGDSNIETFTGPQTTRTHTYATAGSYTITVTVTDNSGESKSSSGSVAITREVPVLTITPDRTAATTTDTVAVSVTSSDPDGSIVTTRVDWGDGTIVTLDGPQTSLTHPYTVAGTFTITITVTDTSGLSTTKTASITVSQTGTGSAFPLPGGPIPWAIFGAAVAVGVLVYFLKLRKPAKVAPQAPAK